MVKCTTTKIIIKLPMITSHRVGLSRTHPTSTCRTSLIIRWLDIHKTYQNKFDCSSFNIPLPTVSQCAGRVALLCCLSSWRLITLSSKSCQSRAHACHTRYMCFSLTSRLGAFIPRLVASRTLSFPTHCCFPRIAASRTVLLHARCCFPHIVASRALLLPSQCCFPYLVASIPCPSRYTYARPPCYALPCPSRDALFFFCPSGLTLCSCSSLNMYSKRKKKSARHVNRLRVCHMNRPRVHHINCPSVQHVKHPCVLQID
jgi:hypothetical protein